MSKTSDGLVQMIFADYISAPSGLSGKLTVNGAAYSGYIRGDNRAIIINYPYDSLSGGVLIKANTIRYTRLYPSYTFNFSVTFVEPEAVFEVTQGEEYIVPITGAGVTDFSQSMLLVYDAELLELVDFAAQTGELHTSTGSIPGTGLSVTSHALGRLVFTFDRDIANGSEWNGVLTLLRFSALSDGEAILGVTVQ